MYLYYYQNIQYGRKVTHNLEVPFIIRDKFFTNKWLLFVLHEIRKTTRHCTLVYQNKNYLDDRFQFVGYVILFRSPFEREYERLHIFWERWSVEQIAYWISWRGLFTFLLFSAFTVFLTNFHKKKSRGVMSGDREGHRQASRKWCLSHTHCMGKINSKSSNVNPTGAIKRSNQHQLTGKADGEQVTKFKLNLKFKTYSVYLESEIKCTMNIWILKCSLLVDHPVCTFTLDIM